MTFFNIEKKQLSLVKYLKIRTDKGYAPIKIFFITMSCFYQKITLFAAFFFKTNNFCGRNNHIKLYKIQLRIFNFYQFLGKEMSTNFDE